MYAQTKIVGQAALEAGLQHCPLALESVPAGWPSPAADYLEAQVNLHEHIVRNPAATFLAKAAGNSMIGAGIHDGDMLVVDRSVEPLDKSIVLACLGSEFTVKRLRFWKNRVYLTPENKDYQKIDVTENDDFLVWGVVTWVLHKI